MDWTEGFEKDKQLINRNRDLVKRQNIKIIWTKKNQKIFSFNPEVNKKENGYLTDPLIIVYTENNALDVNLWGIQGSGTRDALKVKLVDNDLKETYDYLKPYLIQYNLEDNLKYLIKANETEEWNIYNLDEKVKILSILFIVSFTCYLIILFQSNIIIFNKYKKKIVVRRILGLSFIKSYKEFLFIFIISWLLSTLISGAFRKYYFIIDKHFIITLVVLSSIELLYSIISIIKIEKKNKTSILKGE